MSRPAKTDRPTVRNYLAAREQWRLLLLIVPLGVVLLLMWKLRDPETAERVNRLFSAAEQHAIEPPPPDDTKPRLVVAETARDNSSPSTPSLFPGVRAELLPTIEDNTYFRNAETEAWFHFLEILQRAPQEELTGGRRREVDYVQLVDQPDHYRGRLVTVAGWQREVTKQQPAANDLGLETYYRVVIQPESGVPWPILVYCLEPPADATDDDRDDRVHVVGLFFKNLSYSWQDGLGTAPVIVARRIERGGVAASGTLRQPPKAPPAKDWRAPAEPEYSLADVLAIAGWDAQRLSEFDDGEPLTPSQRHGALELLRRLRSFDSASLAEWAASGAAADRVLDDPDNHRGELVRLAGRVRSVSRHTLAPAEAERLEMPQYYECELRLEDAGTAILLTARVPLAWLRAETLDQPATASGLYLKRLPGQDEPSTVWLAKEVAWHPTVADEPRISYGAAVLGSLGMDVGLLDRVSARGRIRVAEREAFYQMLDAAGRVGSHELIRLAERNLAAVREGWERELAESADATRRLLAQEVVRRAQDGRYSVVPMFNEPGSQIGRLVVVDGVARRAMRVEVGTSEGARSSDVARRFGIDHYYELQVFTDDSQNYPLVFCVRELPEGFPSGGSIHVPVRVAGFFFKNWLYRPRGSADSEEAGGGQFAPLLVGRGPVVLSVERARSGATQWLLVGLFVLAMGAIVGAAVWTARGDRRFRDATLAAGFSLPAGHSLDELNVADVQRPMKSSGPPISDTTMPTELQ